MEWSKTRVLVTGNSHIPDQNSIEGDQWFKKES